MGSEAGAQFCHLGVLTIKTPDTILYWPVLHPSIRVSKSQCHLVHTMDSNYASIRVPTSSSPNSSEVTKNMAC